MVAKPMRAALVRRFGEQLVIEQVPVPEIVPGRVLVKLAACGKPTPGSI
jgi:propanol-preferring alcohol dehydrogenase